MQVILIFAKWSKEEKMTFFTKFFWLKFQEQLEGSSSNLKCYTPWVEANTSVNLVPFRLAITELWMLTLFSYQYILSVCMHPIFLGRIIQYNVS